MEVFGQQIKKFRSEKGYTQEKLGQLVGVTTQAVSKWERGSMPDAEIIPLIAQALGVSIEALYGPEEFTADVAKNNVEALKTFFNDNVKKEEWKADEKDQITLNNIYYSTNSDDRAYIVYVYTNATQKYSRTMYMDAEYLYMEDGALKNDGYCSTGSYGKDVKEAVSYCSYLKSPYTPTRIL